MNQEQENRRRNELHGLKKAELLKEAAGYGIDASARSRKNIIHEIIRVEHGLAKGKAVVKTTVQEGKPITTTQHPDGRKDVHIEVNMLDVKETDEATLKAKEAIEKTVLPRLANSDVLVIVVHKQSHEHTQRLVKLPQVRAYAEAVLKSYRQRDQYAKPEDFLVVEHHVTNQSVKVSTLV